MNQSETQSGPKDELDEALDEALPEPAPNTPLGRALSAADRAPAARAQSQESLSAFSEAFTSADVSNREKNELHEAAKHDLEYADTLDLITSHHLKQAERRDRIHRVFSRLKLW